LARKALFDVGGLTVHDPLPGLDISVGEELLKPHKSYVRDVLALRREVSIKGLAHITGGGLQDNVVRVLPEGCRARIRRGSWSVLPVFGALMEIGNIAEDEMLHVFNMGVGMVVVVSDEDRERALRFLGGRGESPVVIGEVLAGERGVEFI